MITILTVLILGITNSQNEDRQSPIVQHGKENSLFGSGMYREAEAAVLRDGNNLDNLLLNKTLSKAIAINLENLGRYQDAITYYDKVLALGPNDVDALYGKGNSLKNLGRFDEAIGYYDKVLKIQPNNFTALANKITLLAKVTSQNESSDGQSPTIQDLIDKGNSLYIQGRNLEAITYYDKVLEIDPNYISALQ